MVNKQTFIFTVIIYYAVADPSEDILDDCPGTTQNKHIQRSKSFSIFLECNKLISVFSWSFWSQGRI